MKSFKNIQFSAEDAIAKAIVNRPAVHNAVDDETLQELAEVVSQVSNGDEFGALIITGAGDQSFVSGADVRELSTRRLADALMASASKLFAAIEQSPKIMIAAVNGYAVGGGCELALACDFRIAAEHAIFAQPELTLGIIPAAGATQRLPRIVGLGRAKQMILAGERIDARTAFEWGLVSSVVPGSELLAASRQLAAHVLSRGHLALRLAKVALNLSSRVPLESGLLIETLAQSICYESADKREGVSAFIEKRTPNFIRR